MIVCDFIDKNVEDFIEKDTLKRIILTFFKEPFDNYRGNKVVFFEDIFDEDDYREIDIFVNKVMKDAEEIFSKYLEVDGYKLFDYFQLQAKRNLSKIYKFKYCIDKLAKGKDKTNVYYFSSELELLEWLKQDYLINFMNKNANKKKPNIKSKIIRLAKNSHFINYIFDNMILKLFFDKQGKMGNILWVGGRLIDSKLIPELQKENRIFLPQYGVHKLRFIKRKYRFNLLKLKDNKKYFMRWEYVKSRYKQGLNEISNITQLNSNLLEIIFKIDKSIIFDLLLTLSILEDNKNNIDLLIVEQSVIGEQALAVDFFNKNKLLSIEILHGVPGVIEVGKTNKVIVYGQRDKSFLSEHGVEKSKVVITGYPYYDRIFNIKDKEKKYDFLLLIPESSPYLRKLLFRQIVDMLRLLKHFPKERLVIKLHPGESEKVLEYICNLAKNIIKDENKVKVIIEKDVISLLRNAKIVYVRTSSVGVEALLMKKPLIILDYLPNRPYNYEKYGGCLVAKDYKNLELSTEKILKDVRGYLRENNENVERTRRYFSGDLKGESYKNVTELINEMLDK